MKIIRFGEKTMTIKRRLFFSNVRMIFITFGSMSLAMYLGRLIFTRLILADETASRFREFRHVDIMVTIPLLTIVLFILIVSMFNNYLTHRMTKRIVKPLEPLTQGVRQISENNFAYRIDYQNEDEFRPVCDAFNEMAAKLETSETQRKKDEANRKELIAGISHDLRTPLTSIKGCVEGIVTGVASTAIMREKYLDIIKNKTSDMEHIIEQLFLFSKLDMDEFPMNMRHTDIALAVYDMVEDSIPEYASRGLEIKMKDMPDNIYVNADVLMLRNVIINILENSVNYKTVDFGKMEISAGLAENSILLRLADDGPGVQAEMLPKLFGVFYRADPSRSTMGSGLGLAISLKIMERMGGSIYAELPEAGGLAVIIRLPLINGDA